FEPSEVIYCRNQEEKFKAVFHDKYYTFRQEDWVFTEDFGRESLNNHFGTKNLKGFGIEEMGSGIIAAGAILQYIKEAEHHKLGHITKVNRIEEDKFVWLDRFTAQNLELIHTPHPNGATLLSVLDQT